MPRRKVKLRIEHLADAHAALAKAAAALAEIDLRATRGPLRDAIREARASQAAATTAVETAIRADTP
jgi:hypothetical protein